MHNVTPFTVVHVLWSLVAGGMETYVVRLVAELPPHVYRPVLCPLDAGGALEGEVRNLGLECHVMSRQPGIRPELSVRLYRLFKTLRADIVHTHHFNGLLYAGPAARAARARLVHTEHALADLQASRVRLAESLLLRLCDFAGGVGPSISNTLRRLGVSEQQCFTITGGVDPRAFARNDKEAKRLEVRRQLCLDNDDWVAVIVARLSPEKNHELLLRAFRRVVDVVPSARLLVVGDGSEAQAVGRAVERLGLGAAVRLLGVRLDVPQILMASDAFVLPSQREGLPIALIEAMTAGLPVVVTPVGDILTVVKQGETGVVVPEEEEAISRALYDLVENPSRAAYLGQNASVAVRAFSVDRMVEAYADIYQRCLSRRRPPSDAVRA